MFGRRALLALPAAAAAGAQAQGVPGLHARARARGLAFGTAITTGNLAEPDLVAAIRGECGVVVAEYEMKWGQIEPQRDQRRFLPGDRLVAFAGNNGMAVRGHTLIWHEAEPAWLKQASAREARLAVRDHVAATVGRWRGRIACWDVVNEAVRPEDGRLDWLRRTRLLDLLGPDHVPQAFHQARAADPAALLAYNDYGCEHATMAARRKRMGVLGLLRWLRQSGAPVQVLGMQAHLNAAQPFEAAEWQDFLSDVAELGLTIEITELDVNDRGLPMAEAARDAGVADLVKRFLDATLAQPAVRSVLTWGLTDRNSWVRRGILAEHRRRDGGTARPLPYDAEMRRKPMWAAIAAALDGAPVRN